MPLLMTLLFLGVVSTVSFGLHLYLMLRLDSLLAPSLEAITGTPILWSTTERWVTAGCLTGLMSSYFLIGKLVSPRRFRWLAGCAGLWMGLFARMTAS